MQIYKEPPCEVTKENRLGGGGNGIVGYIPGICPETAIKIFSVDEKLGKQKRDKRYKRFCKEINVQRELGDIVNGVLPVYDASFLPEYSDKFPAWYTMPRAEKFVLVDNLSLVEKLGKMLELAEILCELHERKMAHRDIKPENILIYNGKIHLADYGLVWMDGEETITQSSERLGPIKIMPPELEEREDIRGCDYKKSDVYLFAKVMWMYLQEDRYGYKGTYDRGEPQVYLDSKSFGVETLEPLHLLMEKATKYEWSEHPTIEECIELVRYELAILMGEFPKEKMQEYIVKEKLSFYKNNVRNDFIAYEVSEKIRAFMQEMIPQLRMCINVGGVIYEVKPCLVKDKGSNFFIFVEERLDGSALRFAIHIQRLEISDESIKVYTSRLDHREHDMGDSVGAELIDGEYIGDIILG